jgi:hypothetical protein
VRLEQHGERLDDRDLPVAGAALRLLPPDPRRAAADLGQGRPDVEAPAGQVDVLPGEREQLPEPQAGEQRGGDGAAPRRGATAIISNASSSVSTVGWREWLRGIFTPSSGSVSRCPSICAALRQLRSTAMDCRTLLADSGPATCPATQLRTWCGWIFASGSGPKTGSSSRRRIPR